VKAKAMITALLLQQPQNARLDVMTEICSRPPSAKATLEGAERLITIFYVPRCATRAAGTEERV